MVGCRLYQKENKSQWDQFIDACRTPLFFFKRDYLSYHGDRFIDASLMFYQEDTLIAVLPSSKQDTDLISHGGLTYGGLLLAEKVRAETVIEIVSALIKTAQTMQVNRIIYKSIPYIFSRMGAQEDSYVLFNSAKARLIRRDLSSVIYCAHRLKLSKGRKWLIARAKKTGLSVSASDDWHSFHSLLVEVLSRHGTKPVHTIQELQHLSQLFPDNIVLKVIVHEGQLLAGTVLFKFSPNVIHTQYMATSEEGKALGALDYLIETCIEESQQEGFSYFNFGISTEEQGTVLNLGLIAQKEHFGARGVALDFYEIMIDEHIFS